MATIASGCIMVLLLLISTQADDIDVELSTGMMIKVLRDMANQTKSDTLNLPANASSIRENITDTFSCENRTYGYYADVDNECQVFHVCLPSQTPSGRNVTYRWSFICPNETIFNQELLTCTRPADSIPCEESESYYDVNMEFGKIPNNTKTEKEKEKEKENKKGPIRIINDKRNKIKRKENLIEIKPNLIPEEVLKEIVDEEVMREEYEAIVEERDAEYNPEEKPQDDDYKDDISMEVNSRLAAERSMRYGNRRGTFRFKSDV